MKELTNKEKMLLGLVYDPSDEELFSLRLKAHKLCKQFNELDEDDEKRKQILKELLGQETDTYFVGPIYFDYGVFTHFGSRCFVNFNFTVLDTCKVFIGNDVFIGPNVSIVTPIHPLLSEERKLYKNELGVLTDKEYGKEIYIGDGCWIASNVVITGGVNIGKGSVIGAGSVVTKDIEENVLAAGNPCKVIRKITEDDALNNIFKKKHNK